MLVGTTITSGWVEMGWVAWVVGRYENSVAGERCNDVLSPEPNLLADNEAHPSIDSEYSTRGEALQLPTQVVFRLRIAVRRTYSPSIH